MNIIKKYKTRKGIVRGMYMMTECIKTYDYIMAYTSDPEVYNLRLEDKKRCQDHINELVHQLIELETH